MPIVGKRIFSNNQDTITFHDYLRDKKGTEIIKQLKSASSCNKIKFLSYNDFIMLTRSFSRNSNILNTNLKNKTSIDDKTIGLIYYEKIISHIEECEKCKKNNGNSSLLECNTIKSIINAYENNFKNTATNIFQQGIDLNRWCRSCDNLTFPIMNDSNEEDVVYINDNDKIEYNCPKFNIKKPGNGRNPIFCTQCNKFIDICMCSNRWSRLDEIKRINRKNIISTEFSKNTKALFINGGLKKNIL